MKLHGRLQSAEALSRRPQARSAAAEIIEKVRADIGGQPDLATVFFTPDHRAEAGNILAELRSELGADVVVGASASGVIGSGEEAQDGPGMSLWAARLPGARVQAFHLHLEETATGAVVRGWPDAGPGAGAVLLADPFSFPLDPFLASLRQSGRAPQLMGGTASGSGTPGGNRLIADEEVHESGAVGFVMDGAVRLQPILTQGCSSVGPRFVVTSAEGNVIHELSGAPAADGLQEVLEGLDEEQRERFRRGPQIGVMVGDGKSDPGGGFLMRGLTRIDPERGSISVNDLVKAGRTVQFHARDSHTAAEEMDSILGIASGMIPNPAGALLFCCNGRGRHMFGHPNHDVEALRRFYPGLPVSGFFAAGEVGPICGQPYLHGFTASIGLLVADQA